MNYVIAAYVATIVLIGGYALSIYLRRRAVQREMAGWQMGEGKPRVGNGSPVSETNLAAASDPGPEPDPAETS